MNTLNSFHFSRFFALWKIMHAGFLVQNRKILITVYAVGVFNFLYFPQGTFADLVVVERSFFWLMYFMVFNTYFSFFFNKWNNKQDAIVYWSLPASLAEKYWATLIYCLLTGALLVMIPWMLSDATRLLIWHWQGKSQELLVFLPSYSLPAYNMFLLSGFLAWMTSTYWLGGMYFTSRSSLKVFFCHLLWVVLLFGLAKDFIYDNLLIHARNSYLWGTVFVLGMLLNLRLAYSLFQKREIVKVK